MSSKGSNAFKLGVIFCTAMLVLSTLMIGATVFGESGDEEQIVLVKIDNTNQIQTLNTMDVNMIDRYNRFVLVEAGEETVETLQNSKLNVDTLPGRTEISVKGHRFDIEEGEPELNSELTVDEYPEGSKGTYIVHVLGPVNPEWVNQLEEMGVKILNPVPNHAYEVRMTPEQAEKVKDLFFVDWVGFYQPGFKLAEDVSPGLVSVIFSNGERMITEVEDEDELITLANQNEVYYINQYQEPELHDEMATQIIGGGCWLYDNDSDPDTAYRVKGDYGSLANQMGYDGDGVVTAIADTGLGDGTTGDAGHPDFGNRVIGGHSYTSDGSWEDGHTHGTHCAGSVGGHTYNGTGQKVYEDYYSGQGSAPATELFSVKIFDGRDFVAPDDYLEIVEVAKQDADAYVHSNSWGTTENLGAYLASAAAYDAAVRDADRNTSGNQPMVITVATGNEGSSDNTICAPATGKNVISVGGTENYNPDQGVDNPDNVPSFSSRGWTDDNRIKPDVVAPGEKIESTQPGGNYGTMSGTSMANPAVAGAASVIVDWYEDVHGERPSPAMVKALLINTAHDLDDANGNTDPIPNKDEGWGMVNLPGLVDAPASFTLEDQTSLLQTGGRDEYEIEYQQEGEPLKITLTYTDEEASAGDDPTLKNDLNLEVESPSGQTYVGNAFQNGWTPAGQGAMGDFDNDGDKYDDVNNVQNVYIHPDDLESGTYTVRVIGKDIPADANNDGNANQDYALVAYNVKNPPEAPSIEVESPNGGESWIVGEEEEIRWTTTQGDNPVESIDLHYSIDSGASWNEIAKDIPDTGNYTWVIPEVENDSSECLVRAKVEDNIGRSDEDTSENYFSIYHPFDLPEVNIISPDNGSLFEKNNVTVKWESKNTQGHEVWLQGKLEDEIGPNETSYAFDGLNDGKNSIEIIALGEKETTDSATGSFVVDTTPPDITITKPEDGKVFVENSVTVEWGGQDETSGIDYYEVQLDSGKWKNVGNATSHSFSGLKDGTHSVSVQAFDKAGKKVSENTSFMVEATPPVVKIIEPEAGATLDQNSVTVRWSSWDNTTSVEHHEIMHNGEMIEENADSNLNQYDLYDLKDGEHEVNITAVDEAGNQKSDRVGFTIDTEKLGIKITSPTDGETLVTDNVTIEWSASSSGTVIDTYEISIDGGDWQAADSENSYTFSDLADGSHTVEVKAVDNDGNNVTDTVNFTVDTLSVPSAPQNLQASAGDEQVNLSWKAPSDDGGTSITEYRIYRGTSSDNLALLTMVTSTSYIDEDVQNNQTYYYQVSAVNGAGEGNRSTEASATPSSDITTPSAPQNLQASAGDEQVNLSWKAPSDDGGTSITEYRIYRGTSSDNLALLTIVTSASYIDEDVQNDKTYYYQVSAVNGAGEGNRSIEASATPSSDTITPSAPQNLQAAAGDGEVELTWEAPSDTGGRSVTEYRIYRGNSSDSLTLLTTIASTSYVDEEVENDETYYYQVSAVNDAGEGDRSAEVRVTPSADLTTPSSPHNLEAVAGDGEVELTWEAPSDDGGSGITEYRIYRGTSSDSLTLLTTVTSTSYIDLDVQNDETYYYQVSAMNDAGEGDKSAEAIATPTVEDTDSGGVSEKSVLASYWWLIVAIVIGLIAAIAVVLIARKKKRPPKDPQQGTQAGGRQERGEPPPPSEKQSYQQDEVPPPTTAEGEESFDQDPQEETSEDHEDVESEEDIEDEIFAESDELEEDLFEGKPEE